MLSEGKHMNKWAIIGLCSTLAACGGGSGTSTPASTATPGTPATSTPTTPAATANAGGMTGIWNGTDAAGASVRVLVMDDGQVWRWVVKDGNVLSVSSGTANSASTTTGALTLSRFDPAGTRASESVGVTYNAGVSFKTDTAINLSYDASFATAPTLRSIYGYPNGQVLPGSGPVTLTIDDPALLAPTPPASVSFGTLKDSSPCVYTGTLTAHSSGRKIFDITITPAGTACGASAGVTYKGIASYDYDDNATAIKLFIAALNPAKDAMLGFYGLL